MDNTERVERSGRQLDEGYRMCVETGESEILLRCWYRPELPWNLSIMKPYLCLLLGMLLFALPFQISHFTFHILQFAFLIPHITFPISHIAFPISCIPFPSLHFPCHISHFTFPISSYTLHLFTLLISLIGLLAQYEQMMIINNTTLTNQAENLTWCHWVHHACICKFLCFVFHFQNLCFFSFNIEN